MRTGLGLGLLGGAVGLAVMEIVRRATAPFVVERPKKVTDVFVSERTMSPFGSLHEPGEPAAVALSRIAYQKLVGRAPSASTKRALAWGIHIAGGLLVGSVYGAIRRRRRRFIRDGALLGAGLWLVGDELAAPLLGLADKPTAYHPTHHAQSLAQDLAFGVSTAATTHVLEGFR